MLCVLLFFQPYSYKNNDDDDDGSELDPFGGGPSALVLLVLAAGINLDINTSDGTTFVVSFWTTGGSIPP